MRTQILRKLRVDWRWAAGELFLVVAGILIAFSIDAWWDDVKEKKDGRKVMQGILDEFLHNQEQLSLKIAQHGVVIRAAQRLLQFTGPDFQGQAPDSVYPLLNEVIQSHTFNPEMGELNALLNSGNLKLIEDNDLGVRLAAWPGKLEDAQEEEDRGVEQVWNTIIPYFNTKIPMLNLLPYTDGFSGAASSRHRVDFVPLFRDPYFENLLENRIVISLRIIQDQTPLLESVEEIIQLLRNNTGNPDI
ncbi:MAG: hypothetical protein H6581_14190 [Bacteroidia bacterium]|nr:hypothetical protein [Bacteroidia bacterium]